MEKEQSFKLKQFRQTYNLRQTDIARWFVVSLNAVEKMEQYSRIQLKYYKMLMDSLKYFDVAIAVYRRDPSIRMDAIFEKCYGINNIKDVLKCEALVWQYSHSKNNIPQTQFSFIKLQELIVNALHSPKPLSVSRINHLCFLADYNYFESNNAIYSGAVYVKWEGRPFIEGLNEILEFMVINKTINRVFDNEGNSLFSIVEKNTYSNMLDVIKKYENFTTEELAKQINSLKCVENQETMNYIQFNR